MSTNEEEHQTNYQPPYSSQHPIPTIQRYREEKDKRRAQAEESDTNAEGTSGTALEATENAKAAKQVPNDTGTIKDANYPDANQEGHEHAQNTNLQDANTDGREVTAQTTNSTPKGSKIRKLLHLNRNDRAEREVTDPVTHLPTQIHDFTEKDLNGVIEKGYVDAPRAIQKNYKRTSHEKSAISEQALAETLSLFPPPNHQNLKEDVTVAIRRSMNALGLLFAVAGALLAAWMTYAVEVTGASRSATAVVFMLIAVLTSCSMLVLRHWAMSKAFEAIDLRIWDTERSQGKEVMKNRTPETSEWLNSTLYSLWPMVNPNIFKNLSDMLEDVMQASLPKFVRMVSVEDFGQGTEAIRILGIKWLPLETVSTHDSKNADKNSDNCGKGASTDEAEKETTSKTAGKDGSYINLEIAFAYKARPQSHSMRKRAQCLHLYVAFYLPSGLKFPVWAEVHGIVGIMRARLQLTPDPPFFDVCTCTLLGQPKIDLSCTPLVKHGLNIMDIPLLSKFIQSSVDAAMASYVAPKSITLNLKDMLMGEDFKKDTDAYGVIVIRIKKAYGFAEGNTRFGKLKSGSSDSYVSVGWAKFGKRVWSTRVIESEMKPIWEEFAYVLVTSKHTDIDERLRIELWDSDRFTADTSLGCFDIDLGKLTHNQAFKNKMSDQVNGFRQLGKSGGMPGQLEWAAGYFPKLDISEYQLQLQNMDHDINCTGDLVSKVEQQSEDKLRELNRSNERELEDQKKEDMREKKIDLLISTPPSSEDPSGILSIQIHQITELEADNTRHDGAEDIDDTSDEFESNDLPSAYCIVILNHQKIFRTRTKPKNSQPFINAGTERFVSDWRNADLLFCIRDARGYENDAILGVVHLPLKVIFAKRSQISSFYPILGGIGHGRIRVSMVFRSVTLQCPRPLLGWDVGTIDIEPDITSYDLPEAYSTGKLRIRTNLGRGKLHSGEPRNWRTPSGNALHLPVRKRYSSNMVIELRHHSILHDKIPAFAVLWLKDIVDDEENNLQIPLWKGDLRYAESNVLSECGERIGTLNIKIRFIHGLSRYHSAYSSKDRKLGEILEVLETMDSSEGTYRHGDDDDTYDSSSGSESKSHISQLSNINLEEDGKRGPVEKILDYKRRSKDLHRHQRGVMQWKAPRTAHWIKHGIEHKASALADHFKIHDRDPSDAIEKEV